MKTNFASVAICAMVFQLTPLSTAMAHDVTSSHANAMNPHGFGSIPPPAATNPPFTTDTVCTGLPVYIYAPKDPTQYIGYSCRPTQVICGTISGPPDGWCCMANAGNFAIIPKFNDKPFYPAGRDKDLLYCMDGDAKGIDPTTWQAFRSIFLQ